MLIQKLRLQRGWSQEQLAELSGLSVRTIQRIENGSPASAESLKSLASVFEIEFSTLLPRAHSTEQATAEQEQNMSRNQANAMLDIKDAPLFYDRKNLMMQGINAEEAMALKRVRKLRGFYSHLTIYAIVITGLVIINWLTSPHYWWVLWTMMGWGIGLLAHGSRVLLKPIFFGANWEKKQVEKILKRPL